MLFTYRQTDIQTHTSTHRGKVNRQKSVKSHISRCDWCWRRVPLKWLEWI